jgi:GntR family transcriptional regulator, transcriptional repressor for pyruvate dehydrogenase complex
MGFVPVGERRTFEAAVDQIAERIRLGEVTLGARLPSERDLAAAMRISRPTLREALRVLADAGVLSIGRGSQGVVVSSDYVPTELLRSKSDLRLDEVAGVLEARRVFEPRVAQLAALHAREEDYARLQQIIDSQKRLLAGGDVLANEDHFLQLDTQFHLRIARASGNSTIVSMMRTLMRRLEIARDVALHEPPTAPWVIEIHERTLAAIRSADPTKVEAVMDEHMSGMERAWERQRGSALVRPIPDFLQPVAARAALDASQSASNSAT